MIRRVAPIALTWALASTGCEPRSPSHADAPPADAAAPDAPPPDAGPPDAGPPDAGPPDAGPPDAGPPDAGPARGPLPDRFAPPPIADGPLVGWSADGDRGYIDVTPFPGGGLLAVIDAYSALTLPTVDGAYGVERPPDGLVTALLAWLDPDGRIDRVEPMLRSRGGRSLWSLLPVGDHLIGTADLSEGWLLPIEGGFEPGPDDPVEWVLEIGRDGAARPLLGLSDTWITAATRRGDVTVLAGGVRGMAAGFVQRPDGQRLDVPADASAWYLILAPEAPPRLGHVTGTAGTEIVAVTLAADRALWLCADPVAVRFGQTVVLDPGGPSETTLTTVSADDDPSTDLVHARLDPDGAVRAAWIHHSYHSGGTRPCATTTIDGDLVAVAPHSPVRGQPVFRWVKATGEHVTAPVAGDGADPSDGAGTIVARYTADGDLVWWRWHSGLTIEERPWFTADTVRVQGPDGLRGRAIYDLETGAPTDRVRAGHPEARMTADGRFVTVLPGITDERAVTAPDAPPFVCPDEAPFCVVVHSGHPTQP